eukprot:TRINITY_DN1291_c0_g1_i2.p1 TRINITY_DN1291_c0_g1~~TRINITY_DN1291_c0_g1_i2.p1  ORF type:complete len:375 (-),score=24.02 TRINITY_DN1291_c0_g1_i2:126-1250(-)
MKISLSLSIAFIFVLAISLTQATRVEYVNEMVGDKFGLKDSQFDFLINKFILYFNSSQFSLIWALTSPTFQQKFNDNETLFNNYCTAMLKQYGPIVASNQASEYQTISSVVDGYLNYTNQVYYDFAHQNNLTIYRYNFTLDHLKWWIDDFQMLTNTSFSLLSHLSHSTQKSFIMQVNEAKSTCDYHCMQSQSISLNYLYPIIFEYARQVDAQMVSPSQLVSLNSIYQYYSVFVDSPNFDLWLSKQTIVNNQVTLEAVIEGMSKFQLYSCIEYLQDLLSIYNIDQMAMNLGITLQEHYYYLSSIFALRNQYNLPYLNYLQWLLTLDQNEYLYLTYETHEAIQTDPSFINSTDWLEDVKVLNICLLYTSPSPRDQA